MTGFVTDIEKETLANSYFRRVLYTGKHIQLVVMALKPEEEIGWEVHPDSDQFLRIESGEGKAIIGNVEYSLGDGSVVIVPAGVEHNIINTSTEKELKLYTIYTPPHHPDGTIHRTKEEAEKHLVNH